MHYLPAMEVVELASDNLPTIWIPRDQVFMMEPEQEKVHPSEVPVPEPVPTPVVKPLEGARDSSSPPISVVVKEVLSELVDPTGPEITPDSPKYPDLRPPPKAERMVDMEPKPRWNNRSGEILDELVALKAAEKAEPKPDKFAKVGKRKPGRPKKSKK